MLDFTSALYLGFGHPSVALAPWRALTLGRPAALEEPPGAGEVAADLADLTGAAAGLLFPSTLHLFRDLFAAVVAKGAMLLIDAQAYPIARWGRRACGWPERHARVIPTTMQPHWPNGRGARIARVCAPSLLRTVFAHPAGG